jgi:hypothetical protein
MLQWHPATSAAGLLVIAEWLIILAARIATDERQAM